MATTDTKQLILDTAQPMVQAHGYNALSFRDVAAAVGIKSASIHYHFPTKGDLGAALARRYTEAGRAGLARMRESSADVPGLVAGFIGVFRAALANGNRMCLIGIMSAEHDDLPDAVKAEVATFSDVCVAWLRDVLAIDGAADGKTASDRAFAIFGAIQGAQLVARGRRDIALFDRMIETYRATGLIP
ncbi:TetR/AcrR family transcriptional regulator [Sphingomonas sp. AP4-R1]|uniref:TetR/AcrR family transcriptional regulator n=1 Tax=Sphingomonas sp. AP4-R1 TaxID=2735134 RepID=UPI0014937B08|nr:TetR/AcrR family transcriptional regulator [Sphingomonas sp. AP4-R1]QJU56734.1 TetR/AcrR family transcriptional regulator [Sphingomonas sp. AP4-R1]